MSRNDKQQADMFQKMAINVVKPLVPPDAEERVKNTFRQMNHMIRECIRAETGLKLADNLGGASIPVRVVEGFPDVFAQLINRFNNPAIWLLLSAQTKLGGVIDGLQHLLKYWRELESWRDFPVVAKGNGAALTKTCEVVAALQTLALTEQVKKEISAIQKDILGAYIISNTVSYIEIYWLPIALVAGMIDVRIEDLTVVVMAHELVHGYTHLGRDIDGRTWETNGFRESELNVIEGLAQLYAQVVADRLSSRVPDARKAFDAFLKLQSGPYVVHQDWLKEHPPQRCETVRFAMLAARSRGKTTHAEWLTSLTDIAPRLGKSEAQRERPA
jgi:hypothetical protein